MSKEVIVVVLDAHPSMAKQLQSGTGQTRFQQGIEATKKLLQQKLLYSSPNHEFALVLVGTPDTANALADKNPDEAKHITTARTLSKIDI